MLLDEDDFRSFWLSASFTTACNNPELCGLLSTHGSPRSCLICVYVFVCVFVFVCSLYRHWHTQLWMDFDPPKGLQVLNSFWCLRDQRRLVWSPGWTVAHPRVSPFLIIGFLDFGWIRWVSLLLPATSEPNSFIQLSKEEIFGSDAYTFSYMISPVSITIAFGVQLSRECVVKDDCVRSCLIELQSFLLSKFYVDTIHSVLMFLPLFLIVPSKTWCFQVNVIRTFVFFVHRTQRRKEYRQSFAQILSSRYQSWICDGMSIDCTSDVTMYAKKLFGINTLSCNEGSMGLRPEWPWRARR